MRNSRRILLCCLALAWAVPVRAGGLVQRFDAAPAGSGWLTLDNLKLSGGLGGAIAFNTSYVRNPLVADSLAVVSDMAMVNLGVAVTWNRFRLSADVGSPLYVRGQSGDFRGYAITAPNMDIASHPDSLTDVRFGFDARLWGDVDGPLRLGAGVHVYLPAAQASEYLSDDIVRVALRLLAAGDIGDLTWAALVGLENRRGGPVDWLQFNYSAAFGARIPLDHASKASLVLGLESFNAHKISTDPRAFSGTNDVQALASARLEIRGRDDEVLRIKLGAGPGYSPDTTTGEWRIIAGIELVGLAASASPTSR